MGCDIVVSTNSMMYDNLVLTFENYVHCDGEGMDVLLGWTRSQDRAFRRALLLSKHSLHFFFPLSGPEDELTVKFSLDRARRGLGLALLCSIGSICTWIGECCSMRPPPEVLCSGLR